MLLRKYPIKHGITPDDYYHVPLVINDTIISGLIFTLLRDSVQVHVLGDMVGKLEKKLFERTPFQGGFFPKLVE